MKPYRTYIIAEIGLNHNGNYDLAAKMIMAAAKSGADAVKFQNYETEDFIFDKSMTYTYVNGKGKKVTENMWKLCKRCEVKPGWLPKLKKICDKNRIDILSTPTSEKGIDELVKTGVKMLKNGSDYLSHLPLLRYMGTTGLPVIISTGMAYANEIDESINAVKESGKSDVILMHCTSLYPTKPEDVNLKRMVALKNRFKVEVGYSDHTEGSEAAIQAVTLGAKYIEKHFTLDNNLPGPDQWFSLNPLSLKKYVFDIREAEKRLGKSDIEPAIGEKSSRKEFRLSIFAKTDIRKGEVIRKSDLIIAKPGIGLPPKELSNIVGKKALVNIKLGKPIKTEFLK